MDQDVAIKVGDIDVAAVVSRGGRPELAGTWLEGVQAPTLLIVGGEDDSVLQANREAATRIPAPHRIEVVPGASHLFDAKASTPFSCKAGACGTCATEVLSGGETIGAVTRGDPARQGVPDAQIHFENFH